MEPVASLAAPVFDLLKQDIQKSYLELFKISPKLEYRKEQIDAMRAYLQQAQDYCVEPYKKKESQYGSELDGAESKLKKTSAHLSDRQRHDSHCEIQNLRALKSQTTVSRR